MSVSVAVTQAVSIAQTVSVCSGCIFELLQVFMGATQHPNREGKLEVGISDRDVLVEHSFDGFLRP